MLFLPSCGVVGGSYPAPTLGGRLGVVLSSRVLVLLLSLVRWFLCLAFIQLAADIEVYASGFSISISDVVASAEL